MGGRSGSFKNSKKNENITLENIKKGAPMTIREADNHNANPNWHGGGNEMHETKILRDKVKNIKQKLDELRSQKGFGKSRALINQYNKLVSEHNANARQLGSLLKKNEGFSVNCQRAVLAYELRRRGYNVIAEPNSKTAKEGYRKAMAAFGNKLAKLDLGKRMPRNVSKRNSLVDSALKQKMKTGERGRLVWYWQGAPGGHTINVERLAKGMRYIDAQTGHVAKSFKSYMSGSSYITRGIFAGVRYERTDNAKINVKDLGDVVKPRKSK